ncbi:MAG TPA: hypothetical protein VKE69_01110, partial [Planctomycetota bacterium]|nr:hypothetical protein [Planctomycetota bacterium]
GLIQFMGRDARPTSRILRGRLAAFVKEQVCRYTVRSIAWERLGPLRYRWPHTGRAPVSAGPWSAPAAHATPIRNAT